MKGLILYNYCLGACGGLERTEKDCGFHIQCSGLLGDRSSSWYNDFTWKMVLKGPIISDTGKKLCMFIVQVSQKTDLQVDMKVCLVKVINWWHWEASVHHCWDLLGDRALSWLSSTQKMVLKRPFISDMGKTLLHLHCSGLPGDRGWSQYNSFIWKMVLERPFISDTGKASADSLFRSVRRQSFESIWKTVLKRPFIGDTREESAHSLFRSPWRQIFNSIWKIILQRSFSSVTGECSAYSLFRSPGIQDIKSVWKFGLGKAIHQWHWGPLCMFMGQIPWETEVFRLAELFLRDVLEMAGYSVLTLWEETKWLVSLVSWDGAFQLCRVILGRWTWNGRTLRHHTGGYSTQSLLIRIMFLKCMT